MPEETKSIEPIHTACKNCVYATYSGITQYDCKLDYISLFKEKKLDILEAYDEDKEFYVINNKKCIGYTTEEWFKQKKLDHLSIDDKVIRYHEQNYIRYLLWIDLMDFITLESMTDLAEELKNISPKPSQIIFLRYKGLSVDIHHMDYIQKILNDANLENVYWRIQTMLDAEGSRYKKIYDSVIHCKHRFFATIVGKPVNFAKIIDRANTIVSKNMDSFNIISNEIRSATVFPVSVYKYFIYQSQLELFEQDSLYEIL